MSCVLPEQEAEADYGRDLVDRLSLLRGFKRGCIRHFNMEIEQVEKSLIDFSLRNKLVTVLGSAKEVYIATEVRRVLIVRRKTGRD